jgi:glycosyltransferase involved in cell wall biosynthesis
MPLVSVIIPAYNVAPYIGETLASVFAQTFTDYEVIVINDGSPDTEALEQALKPYLHRIIYLKQENLGASVARNTGLRAARPELVAFLDADDLWLPNYLDEQVKFIREHDCDLVCADAMMFGEARNAGQTYMEWLMDAAPAEGEVTFLDLVGGRRSLITSGIVTRRELLFNVGLFDKSLRNAQDFDLWLRLARSGARLMYHRKTLLRYRIHAGSLTGDALNTFRRESNVLDKIENSYDLTAAERAKVSPLIHARRGFLEFELGKLLIAQGDVAGAQNAFQKACAAGRNWKRQAAFWGSRMAPKSMQAFCLRRQQRAAAK